MTFGIIGYGRFGKLWTKHLALQGKVFIFDRNSAFTEKKQNNLIFTSLRQACRVDILFLLVPISEMENICKKIKSHLSPQTIVADSCSVKIMPSEVMKKYLPENQPIIATHALFGPDSVGKAKTFKGFKIAIAPIRATIKQKKFFERILKKLGAEIFHTTPKSHDRQMANSQGLIHFIGRGLNNLKLKTQEIATPDYLSLLHIRDMVVHDTWQLFFDMQKYNKFMASVRHKFLLNLIGMENAISQKLTLKDLRGQINRLDHIIVKIISKRITLAKQAGRIKKIIGAKITDGPREKKLKAWHSKLSQKHGLDKKEIDRIFAPIIRYSKKVQ